MNEEAQMQIALVYWLKKTYPEVLFTISPIAKLPIGVARKMKAMGYSKGTPDLMIFEPRGAFYGMFIELKTERGRVTPEQYHWHSKLADRCYYVAVCRSCEDAMLIIQKYLK